VTVNCIDFHRSIGANPEARDPALQQHRAACPACEGYAQEMLRLNGLIRSALQVPVPAAQPFKATEPAQRGWLALAASLVAGVGLAGLIWFAAPSSALAKAAAEHIAQEPDSLAVTADRIPDAAIDAELRANGMHLRSALGDVSFYSTCVVQGNKVPHLVVQTTGGPVTVIMLTKATIRTAERFDEQSYHGTLLPLERGAMVVLAKNAAVVDAVADKVRNAIAFD
jgi:hypothetical protein